MIAETDRLIKIRDQRLDKSSEVSRVSGRIDAGAGKCSLEFSFVGEQDTQLRGELQIVGEKAKMLEFDMDAKQSQQMRSNQRRWAAPLSSIDQTQISRYVRAVQPHGFYTLGNEQTGAMLPKWLNKEIENILQEQSNIEALDAIEEHSKMRSESMRKDLSINLDTILAQQLDRIEMLRRRIYRADGGLGHVRKMLNSGSFAQVWLGLMLARTLRVSLQKELQRVYLQPPENSERLGRLAYRLLLPQARRDAEVERGRKP